ncbi:MFS transporter [Pararhodobacter sp. CCB-MM2]|uniref:MFS transporter n=1 Tax=Pararhodobacter sp. CCB-MM2 TaxID=1786003 RepID=UPI000833A289|nr:MFS transporter [Pararhodobacter sp. CCB-MM2]
MSSLSDRAAPAWLPIVAVVTLVQAVLALMGRVLPLLGMPLTAAAGMPPEAVGQLSSANAFGSMVFFLWGPTMLSRMASIRQLQLGCVVSAAALVLCAFGRWEALLLASVVIGLGYGTSTPAGADLLMRVVPRERRATIFSIKQAGVPLGGLAAGLMLPAAALHWGGVPAALMLAAGLALGSAALLGLWKGEVDDRPPPAQRLPRAELLLAPIRLIGLLLRSRPLRLVTVAGFCLGIAQGVVMGFYPVFLSDQAGWSLAAAGAGFALLQGTGIVGRVAMGWLADVLGDTVRALTGLCLVSGVTMGLLATISRDSPTGWILLLSALAGVTVVSWNGVFLTGLAETAPEGKVGEITAAGTFVLFAGYVVSPLLVQVVFASTEGYATGLILSGLAPALAGLALMIGARRRAD